MTGPMLLLVAGLLACGCARGASPGSETPAELAAENERQVKQLMDRARAAYARADYTRAEQYLNLAREGGTNDAELTPLLIDVCVKDQRYRAALQYSEERLR